MAICQQDNNNYIHYLCRTDDGLVFPNELDEHYSSLGSFYILGNTCEDPVSDSYLIHAIDDHNIVELLLVRDKRNKNFFIVEHENYGRFIFLAENTTNYRWRSSSSFGNFALMRLRIWNVEKATDICKNKHFYFVGYSNLD